MKGEHQALIKSNLQLKNQHEIMKKKIISQAKNRKPSLQKETLPPKHPKAARPFALSSPKYQTYSKNQDDIISLSLSVFSVDNILE